jgi:hypothetical protein
MKQNLTQAFFSFRHQLGSNGRGADVLLKRFANEAPTNDDAEQAPLSHNLLRARLDFVEEGARECFYKHDIEPMTPKLLDNGGESLVFDCSNGYVLKIRKGESVPYFKNCPHLLQPLDAEYSQYFDVTFSIFPKIETAELTNAEIYAMQVKTYLSGYRIADPTPCNFGKVRQGNKNKTVIIDEGAVKPIMHPIDIYRAARDILKPVYNALPILHPLWQTCRDTAKEILGLPPRAKSVPNSFALKK